jgi:hypothetical protein
LRIIYYFFPGARQIWLMTLFGKNEAADLTPKEKRAMKAAIEAELHARRRARAKKLRRNPR